MTRLIDRDAYLRVLNECCESFSLDVGHSTMARSKEAHIYAHYRNDEFGPRYEVAITDIRTDTETGWQLMTQDGRILRTGSIGRWGMFSVPIKPEWVEQGIQCQLVWQAEPQVDPESVEIATKNQAKAMMGRLFDQITLSPEPTPPRKWAATPAKTVVGFFDDDGRSLSYQHDYFRLELFGNKLLISYDVNAAIEDGKVCKQAPVYGLWILLQTSGLQSVRSCLVAYEQNRVTQLWNASVALTDAERRDVSLEASYVTPVTQDWTEDHVDWLSGQIGAAMTAAKENHYSTEGLAALETLLTEKGHGNE